MPIANEETGTRIDEIADGIHRISTPIPPNDQLPPGFTFNQFLITDDEPLLFHTGLRQMFPLLRQDQDNPLELFQIWLNLPADKKFTLPHFSMLWNDSIPTVHVKDDAGRSTELRVVAGRVGDNVAPSPPPNSWAAAADSDVAIWTLKMAPGASWTLPTTGADRNRTLYVFRGSSVQVGPRKVARGHLVEIRADVATRLVAGPDETELLMLQGRPIGEPVAQHGPFVMNTRAEIQQAYADYRKTRFGGWPWPNDEPVHGADGQRFARRPDGTVERPA